MPYSLSHAVVSLPVFFATRGNIPLAALFVGCISPDFPYFLALTPIAAPGHSIPGVLIYCLIPSLLVLFIWYRWLEKPTLDLFRLPQRRQSFSTLSYYLIVFGVLIGAYSHVLWDATSHINGAFVINSNFWNMEFLSLPLYKWNQYSGGVLGLIALVIWYWYALSKNKKFPYQGHLKIGLTVYLVSIIVFIVLANVIHGSSYFSEIAVRSAVGIITGGVIGMIVYALIVNLNGLKKIS